MSRPTVITSFTAEQLDLYANKFCEGFIEHWPGVEQLRAVLYIEAQYHPKDVWGGRFEFRRVPQDMPKLRDFLAKLELFPFMCGTMPDGSYNIQFDARMGRKAFIEMDAAAATRDRIFWIDADTITHSTVPVSFLDECLPESQLSCYLGRDGWAYTESGFIGFNGGHPDFDAFRNNYLWWFLSGAFSSMTGFHDCFAFDATRKNFPAEAFNNLAAGLPHGTMHPFINSPLGAYMDHRKGPRKASRSMSSDLVKPRTEPYWVNA